MMNDISRKTIQSLGLTFGIILLTVPVTAFAEAVWDPDLPQYSATGEGDGAVIEGIEGGREIVSPNPDTTLADDRAYHTSMKEASSDAQTFTAGRICDGETHVMEMEDGSSVPYACKHLFQGSNSNEAPQRVPTTREILYRAATVIHADGAGLYKRPLNVSYTNRFIPSIVAVLHPAQVHTVSLLGREVTVTFTATQYEWSWGDGTANLVTTSTGSVWHEGMDLNNDPRLIRHYYTPPQGWRSGFDGPYPHENREITLTTTWSGTATNPFTGETQTINGLVTTTETTGPFPLSHLVINNTDTWEEKQGH